MAILINKLEGKHEKFYELLKQKDAVVLFHQKCNNFISAEIQLHLKNRSKKSNLFDGAQENFFEELKIKLLSKAINRLKPFFYTV